MKRKHLILITALSIIAVVAVIGIAISQLRAARLPALDIGTVSENAKVVPEYEAFKARYPHHSATLDRGDVVFDVTTYGARNQTDPIGEPLYEFAQLRVSMDSSYEHPTKVVLRCYGTGNTYGTHNDIEKEIIKFLKEGGCPQWT